MAFRVGQKVVCVDAAPRPNPAFAWSSLPTGLRQSSIYTVRGSETSGGVTGIYVDEVRSIYPPFSDGPERSYYPDRFRPVISKSTDTGMAIFREILDRETDKPPVKAKLRKSKVT